MTPNGSIPSEELQPRDGRLSEIAQPGPFQTAFANHHGEVWRFLARRFGRDVADDLTAATFETAFASWQHFDPARGEVRPWLFGIAVNVGRRHRRREERQLRLDARRTVETAQPQQRSLDSRAPLAAALRAMDARDREVLLLFAIADLSYSEIAEALDVPEGTVRSRLHRARNQVKEALQSERH